jgi:2-polyprenyl-6-methoxyphenol hydroxylase-like FAD-dependent oxidoreductase
MSQVVIIGAGPTGLTLAMLLAQRGIDVKLIEASRNFRRTFRGEALMPSGLEAIEFMGLTDLVARIPHRPLDAWEFIIQNRSIFRVDEPMEPGGRACTLISQPDFLAGVMAIAKQYSNFEFIAGTAVRDFLWERDRAVGVILGDDRQIDAELIIGADGRSSIVRQKAKLPLDRQAQSFDILWFKLARSPEVPAENIFYSILCGKDGFGLFVGCEGQLQIGWSLHRQVGDDSNAWQRVNWQEKLVAAAPDWLVPILQQQKIEKPVLLSVTVGLCPQWYAPGVLLLGDAAHPMSPVRAQGINMGLRDVIVATNYLVPLLQRHAKLTEIDAVLPQIQAEREPEIIQIQKLQSAEVNQGKLMQNYAPLRYGVSWIAPHLPLIRARIRQSWIDRQLLLRRGVTPVALKV